jgi:hypothetical protein
VPDGEVVLLQQFIFFDFENRILARQISAILFKPGDKFLLMFLVVSRHAVDGK